MKLRYYLWDVICLSLHGKIEPKEVVNYYKNCDQKEAKFPIIKVNYEKTLSHQTQILTLIDIERKD